MQTVNVHEAKTHLSRLLNRISAGEEIIIAKAGKPVARLVPFRKPVLRREPGLDRGKFRVPDDFDAPLSADPTTAHQSHPRPARGRAPFASPRSL